MCCFFIWARTTFFPLASILAIFVGHEAVLKSLELHLFAAGQICLAGQKLFFFWRTFSVQLLKTPCGKIRPQCKLLDFITIVIIYIKTCLVGKQKISPKSHCNILREKFTSKFHGFLWAILILFLLPFPWLDPEQCWLCTGTQRKELSCNSQLVHLRGFATLLQKCACDLKTSDLCFPLDIKITWH